MRGLLWPAGFDVCASKYSIRVLVCAWSQMLQMTWTQFGVQLRCAAHKSGTSNPLREAMTSQLCILRALLSLTVFVNNFNCSKHDVTMASGSQATVRTCNLYSGSNVRRFCSRCGRHNTLSLLTVITKVLVEYIVYFTISELGLRACQILMERSK